MEIRLQFLEYILELFWMGIFIQMNRNDLKTIQMNSVWSYSWKNKKQSWLLQSRIVQTKESQSKTGGFTSYLWFWDCRKSFDCKPVWPKSIEFKTGLQKVCCKVDKVWDKNYNSFFLLSSVLWEELVEPLLWNR